ncbi:hypothetical protein DRW07_05675 [Alteromonas sediminis]|uniref:Uncharacterized protein n=1 Tax=Alteromonas sediminis TaxID=2259342 RepID=A0A3N5Z8B0_9ALTE|nr:DUF6445 family protein [Alteromonas sediminis]RPJ67034.1 hypothetical protein DRW07_05675 [Alteromonas sediminis]
MQPLQLNPNRKTTVIPVQEESAHLLVVDNLLVNPEEIVLFARNTAYMQPAINDGTAYPGIRDRVPTAYEKMMQALVSDLALVSDDQTLSIHRCMLSMVTTPPDQLASTQKIPHIDSIDPYEFASVHYLFDADYGGTNIYRHKQSQKVCIDEAGFGIFQSSLEDVRANPDEFSGYIGDSNRLFECVHHIEAKFNRLVIYKGNMLHSPCIKPNFGFSDDVTKGRLSVASFFRID